VQCTEHLQTQFCQSPVRTRDLCREITPIQAPSQGTLHARSSTTCRNCFPDTSHKEILSCPRAITVNNSEISGHSAPIRPRRNLYPQCSCIAFIVKWLKMIPETEGPRKRGVAVSAHRILCVQTSYNCVQVFALENIKLRQR